MFASSKGRQLLVGAAMSTGVVLAALEFGAGAAAADPLQPAPADIPFLPTPTDPGIDPTTGLDPASALPTGSGFGLPNAGGLIPLIGDTTKLMTAGNDPNTLLAATQSLLNDAGSLLGLPGGMPNVSSFVPSTGVPNVSGPLAPSSPMMPGAPLSPLAPPAPVAPFAPLAPAPPALPVV